MEEELYDKFGNAIKLPNKRWKHIVSQHPEVEPYKDKLPHVLKNPDLVKLSKRSKDIFLYYHYYKDIYKGKYLLAVARTRDKPLLLTCYITDRIKKGDLIWKKD